MINTEMKALLKEFLKFLNINQKFIDDEIIKKNFELRAIRLSNSNIYNKEKTKDTLEHTTHIAITGDTREFFFDISEIENTSESTDDIKQPINIIDKNLDYLKSISDRKSADFSYSSQKNPELLKIFTVKKISKRSKQKNQVHLSKKHKDDEIFFEYRKTHRPEDLLMFIKFEDEEEILSLTIPREWLKENNYEIKKSTWQVTYNIIDDKEKSEEEFNLNPEDFNLKIDQKPTQNNNSNKSTSPGHSFKSPGNFNNYSGDKQKKTGDFGEELIYNEEKKKLKDLGELELAEKVEWTAKEKGDGYGYDVKSFTVENGKVITKYIEVKTTLGEDGPFFISAAEVKKSEEISTKSNSKYILSRVYNVNKDNKTAKYYESEGPIRDNFELEDYIYKGY